MLFPDFETVPYFLLSTLYINLNMKLFLQISDFMALATIKEQTLILFASEYSGKIHDAVKILASNF